MSDTGGNLVSFTMDPATGQVVKIETLDRRAQDFAGVRDLHRQSIFSPASLMIFA